MNIYVETNFVLELSFSQEQYTSCEEILALCESDGAKLVVPAYSLAEVHEKLTRQARRRKELQRELIDELAQLKRTESYVSRITRVHDLANLLIQSNEEEKQRFTRNRNRIVRVAEIIPLTAPIIRKAAAYEAPYNLTSQDALVYASVVTHIDAQNQPTESCFLNRNAKDFDNPDIVDELARKNCRMIPRFDDGFQFVQTQLQFGGKVQVADPMYADFDYRAAHKHSSEHYDEIAASSVCGCFYCLAIFPPSDIVNWIQENPDNDRDILLTGQTALCPICGIDSVIGSASGYPMETRFLEIMHDYWF